MQENCFATREEMIAEAIVRMKMLGIYPPIIEQYKQDGQISQSECPFGAYYWIDEKSKVRIAELEQQYDGIVYNVIRSHTHFGLLDSCLWVSKYKEEWERDRKEITEGIVFAYVINRDDEICSEFGSIGVKLGIAGGLIRIA